jgi:RNA polymerase sigma-70 factor (ECF subfamily)
MILKNTADAEDVTQTVFIKLMNAPTRFDGNEHVKAWLITVTRNACRDMAKSWWRSKRGDMDGVKESAYSPQDTDRDIWNRVMGLHEKYKLPVYLYYYEGYDTGEISRILKINHSTVRTRLRTARLKLRQLLEEDWNDAERA